MGTYIEELCKKGKEAYWIVSEFDQKQIDRILGKMAKTVFEHAQELGAMTFEETRMGSPAYSIGLMQKFPLIFWNYLKGKNAFGVIDEDKEKNVQTYGKGMGVVACLTPSTTNISNGFEITMKAVKSGNAIIIAPHPRAWKCCKRMVELMREAIISAGGPENLVQSLEDPTLESTAALMSACDVVVGTGGADMVKAAYSSGTPAFGVGQGCVPVIISEAYPANELDGVIKTLVADRSGGGGVACSCPQLVMIPRSRADEILKLYADNKAFIVEDEAVIDRIREIVFPGGGARINRDVVGKAAPVIAGLYGIKVPDDTQIILLRMKEGVRARQDVLTQEIMNPTQRFQVYDDYAEAVEIARANLLNEGAGHSAQIWSYDQKEIDLFAKRVPVVRVLVRTGHGGSSNLAQVNGLAPATTVGCGTWGGNSFSHNLDYTTLQNHTLVLYPRVPAVVPPPEVTFADVE